MTTVTSSSPTRRRGERLEQAASGTPTHELVGAAASGTLPGLFLERVRRTPEGRAYMAHDPGEGIWQEVSWRDVANRAARFRAAMEARDLEKGDRIAVLLPNGVDWVCVDMAALSLGLVVVPLYTHDSASNQAYILDNADVRLAVIDTHARWAAIAALGEPMSSLEEVWIRNEGAGVADGRVRRLAEVLPDLAPTLRRAAADPQDLATLIYTSGTTGRPKGVMLSHAAILWNAEAVTRFVAPKREDVFLSFLPLAHAFERTVGYYLPMMAGATVAHARSVELLRQDLKTVRPTVFLSVPRLYERIYKAIHERSPRYGLRRALLHLEARLGWADFEWQQGRGPRPEMLSRVLKRLLDRLVARHILDAFGGRVRVSVSGGAALPPRVARFLIGMGLPLVEGYGLTEAAPVVTAASLEDNFPGSVGRALPGSEIHVAGGRELLVRSPSIMQGYWKDEAATAAAITEDGWLRTGDIAEIRDGRVFIRGRLKEIIVLSNGENINPDPMETAILRDPAIEQACVLGEGKPFPVAVLVLEQTRWAEFAGESKLDPANPNVPSVTAEILKNMRKNMKDFPKPAQIRAVHLLLDPWTIDEGLLTPTLKVKRHAVEARYTAEITSLYGTHAVLD